SFRSGPTGFPSSYLPYLDTQNIPQALPFTVPGQVAGSSIAVGSSQLWGVESDLIYSFSVALANCRWCVRGGFIVGARYLDLKDRDMVSNRLNLVSDPSEFAFGKSVVTTHNQFVGAQLGCRVGLTWDSWDIDYTTKLAGGITHQNRDIAGGPLLSESS